MDVEKHLSSNRLTGIRKYTPCEKRYLMYLYMNQYVWPNVALVNNVVSLMSWSMNQVALDQGKMSGKLCKYDLEIICSFLPWIWKYTLVTFYLLLLPD